MSEVTPPATPISHPLKSTSQRLVPTRYSRFFSRETGMYDSRDRLPAIEAVFDRILNQIKGVHESRSIDAGNFEVLWKKVCDGLEKHGNATAYFEWKQKAVNRSRAKLDKLNGQIAEVWANRNPVADGKGNFIYVFDHYEEFDSLVNKRAKIEPRLKTVADDFVEVAIAYWIEARNAHNSGDHARTSFAMMECNFHLGIASSPKTESEAKREAGRMAGRGERVALMEATVEVMKNFDVTRAHNKDFIIGLIVRDLGENPQHRATLDAYDRSTVSESKGTPLSDRFGETLLSWVTSDAAAHKQIRNLYLELCAQIAQRKSLIRNSLKGKAIS